MKNIPGPSQVVKTRKIQVQNILCTNIVLNVKTKKKIVTTCSELVFIEKFNEQSLVILWVN